MAERETFADKVGKNIKGFEGEPVTIQIPYWLAWSVRTIQGEKSFEEYVLDAIEDRVRNDNSMRMVDARLLENYLQIYRRNRDEQKANSGNAGFDSENQDYEDNGNRGADK